MIKSIVSIVFLVRAFFLPLNSGDETVSLFLYHQTYTVRE